MGQVCYRPKKDFKAYTGLALVQEKFFHFSTVLGPNHHTSWTRQPKTYHDMDGHKSPNVLAALNWK